MNNQYLEIMKSLKTITLLLSVLAFSCSSDDDNSSEDMQSTSQLLTESKWYQQSKSPGSFSDCEKNGSFKFNTDNSLNVESFDDSSGTCEFQGTVNTTYTLSGMTLTLTFGTDVITATINSISETTLNVTDSNGDTVVLDKTQG